MRPQTLLPRLLPAPATFYRGPDLQYGTWGRRPGGYRTVRRSRAIPDRVRQFRIRPGYAPFRSDGARLREKLSPRSSARSMTWLARGQCVREAGATATARNAPHVR